MRLSLAISMITCTALLMRPELAQAGAFTARAIAAGKNHTCALTPDAGVACWGDGTFGQLGDGRNQNSSHPQRVLGLTRARQVAAGGSHSCAVLDSGRVSCWGKGREGQLGYGTEPGTTGSRDSSTAKEVRGLENDVIQMLALGDAHSCALTARGAVKCWGQGGHGELGDGVANPQPGIWRTLRTASTMVRGILGEVKEIAAGGNHTCARTSAGAVFCWGVAELGRLGDGRRVVSSSVAVQAAVRGVTALAAGEDHTCAVAGGALECWGDAAWGQLGNVGEGAKVFESEPTPIEVHASLRADVRLAAGGRGHTCVVLTAAGVDRVQCLGDRTLLALGPEASRIWITPQSRDAFFAQRVQVPKTVAGAGASVRALVAGKKHTCSLDAVGAVRCWGHGFFGQLGNGGAREAGSPQLVRWL